MMRRGSVLRRVALAILLVVSIAVPGGPVSAARKCKRVPSMTSLTFGDPKIIDPVRAGGEPSVLGLTDGTLLYAAHASTTLFYRSNMPDPDYVSPYTNVTYLWRSTDAGTTWAYVGLGGAAIGPHAAVVGWSDPDLAQDAAGNVYTSGITLANVYVAKSSDSGRTWSGQPLATVLTDREWLAADQANVVYMNGNQEGTGRRLWRSTDGGVTFNGLGIALPGGGPPSKIQVDPSDGRLYFATGQGGVAIYPQARSNTFTRTNSAIVGGTPHAHGFLNNLAIDSAGNVYLVSNTSSKILVSRSTDRGIHWTTDTIHDASPNTVLWPWISAGADGRVGVSWLQADRRVDDTEEVFANYRIMAAQTITGHGWVDQCGTAHAPDYSVAVATADPIHSGTICSSGTICQAFGTDRRLGDYHTNSITADGRFVIAYANTSFKPSGAISHPAFVRQTGGVDFRP